MIYQHFTIIWRQIFAKSLQKISIKTVGDAVSAIPVNLGDSFATVLPIFDGIQSQTRTQVKLVMFSVLVTIKS